MDERDINNNIIGSHEYAIKEFNRNLATKEVLESLTNICCEGCLKNYITERPLKVHIEIVTIILFFMSVHKANLKEVEVECNIKMEEAEDHISLMKSANLICDDMSAANNIVHYWRKTDRLLNILEVTCREKGFKNFLKKVFVKHTFVDLFKRKVKSLQEYTEHLSIKLEKIKKEQQYMEIKHV